MTEFDKILETIYNEDCNIKGYSIDHKETFVIERNQNLYLVLLMKESDFNHSMIGYRYAIYSLTEGRCIHSRTDEYNKFIETLPNLYGLTRTILLFDILIERDFLKSRDELINEICAEKRFTQRLKDEYINYLRATEKRFLDGSFRSLCAWFKQNIKL